MNAIMIVMNEFITRADCECENCIGVICAPESRWKSYLEPTGHNLWIDDDIDVEEDSDDEDNSVCRCGKQIPEDTGKCCGCCEDCCCCFDSEDDDEEIDTREDIPQDSDDEEYFVYEGM